MTRNPEPIYNEPIYNEPMEPYKGDVIPSVSRPSVRSLSPVVRARLELEASLGGCGVDEGPSSLRWTVAHRTALAAMLVETDSPTSAHLRAEAVAVAGAVDEPEIVALVRDIALDRAEDTETRIAAVGSLLTLSLDDPVATVDDLLSTRDVRVRQAAYIAASRSSVPDVVEHTSERFRSQRNELIARAVEVRAPKLQQGTTSEARRG
jgi:hypothetical protein